MEKLRRIFVSEMFGDVFNTVFGGFLVLVSFITLDAWVGYMGELKLLGFFDVTLLSEAALVNVVVFAFGLSIMFFLCVFSLVVC